MSINYVIDTETASLAGGVCDIAIAQVDNNLNIVWQSSSLIDPQCEISPSASGIHRITYDMVENEPTLEQYVVLNEYPFSFPGINLIGHNVAFDIKVLGNVLPSDYTKLCTLKLSRLLWPDAPDHKLQTLRYQFRLESGDAHRAMGDVMTCVSLLRAMAEYTGKDLQGLQALANSPLPLTTAMPFGKHKGTPLQDLPRSYVRWLLDTADIDPDLREALLQRNI